MKRRDWWLMPKEPFWTPSRLISGLIFIFVAAASIAFTEDARKSMGLDSNYLSRLPGRTVLGPAFVGVLCIWFPAALGGMIGGRVNQETPGEVLYWFGWVMLIVTGILFLVL